MTYKITSLAGDGIGPEIMTSGLQVLEAVAKNTTIRLKLNLIPLAAQELT